MIHLSDTPNEIGLSPLVVGAWVSLVLAMVALARIVDLGGKAGLAVLLVAATAGLVLFATTWIRPDFGLAGFVFALPLYLVWAGQSRPASDVGTTFTLMGAAKDLAFAVIVLGSLRRLLLQGTAPMRSPLILTTAGFLGMQFLYIFLSPQLLPALWGFRSVAEFAVILFILPYVITDRPSLNRLLSALTLGNVLVVTLSALTVLQTGAISVDSSTGYVYGGVSVFGSYLTRGSAATYASFALLLALALLLDRKQSWWLKLVNRYTVVAGALAVLFTFERRGWLGVAVGLVLIAILGRVRRGMIIGALVVVVFVSGISAISGVSGVREAISARLTGDLSSPLYSVRLAEWAMVLDRVRDTNFIGEGVGSGGPTGATFAAEDYVNSHSYYLLLLLETGIPGLLSFAAVIWSFLRMGRHSLQQHFDDEFRRAVAIAALVGGINILVQSFFTVGMAIFPFNLYFWLFGGMLIVLPRLSSQSIMVRPGPNRS